MKGVIQDYLESNLATIKSCLPLATPPMILEFSRKTDFMLKEIAGLASDGNLAVLDGEIVVVGMDEKVK